MYFFLVMILIFLLGLLLFFSVFAFSFSFSFSFHPVSLCILLFVLFPPPLYNQAQWPPTSIQPVFHPSLTYPTIPHTLPQYRT